MRLEVRHSAHDAVALVVEMLVIRLVAQPTVVLGLPTGATPLPVYKLLVQAINDGQCDLSEATTFNLDEYYGLGPEDPQSYAHYMRVVLFDHVNHQSDRLNIPDGLAESAKKEGSRYEAAIAAAGGIDLMLLGLGQNGHIGFNEPGSSARSRTRLVMLSDSTLSANAQHFQAGTHPPHSAITMGIATILDARQIILLAIGESKAEALRRTIEGLVSTRTPSSLLQRHSDVVIIADGAASSKLSVVDESQRNTTASFGWV